MSELSWNSEISLELKIIQWRIRCVNKNRQFFIFWTQLQRCFCLKTWKNEKFLGFFLKNAFNDCGLASYYANILISFKFSSFLDQSQHSSSIRFEMTSHWNELILTVKTKNSLSAKRYIFIQGWVDAKQIELQQNFFCSEKHNRITYQRKKLHIISLGILGAIKVF